MSRPVEKLPENKRVSDHQRMTNDERFDLITPAWRRFRDDYWWPYSRLDRCNLDELLRLRKAVPYLLAALDDAIDRKEACV